MRKTEEEQGMRLMRYALGVILGGAAALVACFVFLLIASLGISRGLIGEGLTYQITVVGCVLGAFVGGTLAVRRCGSRSLLVGLAAGVVGFLLMLTVGVLFFNAVAPESGSIGLLCGCLCGGAAAGILGGKPCKHTAKKKRRK